MYRIVLIAALRRLDAWCHRYELDAESYIESFELLDQALKAGRRPTIPAEFEENNGQFVKIMRSCWATDPASRPRFDTVVMLIDMIRAVTPAQAPIAAPAMPPMPAFQSYDRRAATMGSGHIFDEVQDSGLRSEASVDSPYESDLPSLESTM
jgi:hypothetical protein